MQKHLRRGTDESTRRAVVFIPAIESKSCRELQSHVPGNVSGLVISVQGPCNVGMHPALPAHEGFGFKIASVNNREGGWPCDRVLEFRIASFRPVPVDEVNRIASPIQTFPCAGTRRAVVQLGILIAV